MKILDLLEQIKKSETPYEILSSVDDFLQEFDCSREIREATYGKLE